MGSSKLALIGAVYTIINLYTFSFNSADSATGLAAYTTGNSTRAEQLSKAGVGLAIVHMRDSSNVMDIPSATVYLMGDTVTYSVKMMDSSTDRIVTATASVGNVTVTTKAQMHYGFYKNVWRTSKIASQTSVKNIIQ
jgi:hypothetical protein